MEELSTLPKLCPN
uniref:Uncharacterized protein n=1 Tax=Anguilla anguilla TaxID=7936 RepID=A0A0E9RFF9_ANGAN